MDVPSETFTRERFSPTQREWRILANYFGQFTEKLGNPGDGNRVISPTKEEGYYWLIEVENSNTFKASLVKGKNDAEAEALAENPAFVFKTDANTKNRNAPSKDDLVEIEINLPTASKGDKAVKVTYSKFGDGTIGRKLADARNRREKFADLFQPSPSVGEFMQKPLELTLKAREDSKRVDISKKMLLASLAGYGVVKGVRLYEGVSMKEDIDQMVDRLNKAGLSDFTKLFRLDYERYHRYGIPMGTVYYDLVAVAMGEAKPETASWLTEGWLEKREPEKLIAQAKQIADKINIDGGDAPMRNYFREGMKRLASVAPGYLFLAEGQELKLNDKTIDGLAIAVKYPDSICFSSQYCKEIMTGKATFEPLSHIYSLMHEINHDNYLEYFPRMWGISSDKLRSLCVSALSLSPGKVIDNLNPNDHLKEIKRFSTKTEYVRMLEDVNTGFYKILEMYAQTGDKEAITSMPIDVIYVFHSFARLGSNRENSFRQSLKDSIDKASVKILDFENRAVEITKARGMGLNDEDNLIDTKYNMVFHEVIGKVILEHNINPLTEFLRSLCVNGEGFDNYDFWDYSIMDLLHRGVYSGVGVSVNPNHIHEEFLRIQKGIDQVKTPDGKPLSTEVFLKAFEGYKIPSDEERMVLPK